MEFGPSPYFRRIFSIALITALSGFTAFGEKISYTTTQTVSTPLAVTEATEIEVASGKTVTFDASAVISGASAITKTGAGK